MPTPQDARAHLEAVLADLDGAVSRRAEVRAELEAAKQAVDELRDSVDQALAVLGVTWVIAGERPDDRELLGRLYWGYDAEVRVESMARAFQIRAASEVHRHVPPAGDAVFRCRPCGAVLQVGFRSRDEMRRSDGYDRRLCPDCAARQAAEDRIRGEELHAESLRRQAAFDELLRSTGITGATAHLSDEDRYRLADRLIEDARRNDGFYDRS